MGTWHTTLLAIAAVGEVPSPAAFPWQLIRGR